MKSVSVLLLVATAILAYLGTADAGACNSCGCINASPTERCMNGYCRMSRGTAICICDSGYQGNRCQNRVASAPIAVVANACQPNPCQNGGFCSTSSGGSYYCWCTARYSGLNCQTTDDPCTNNVCAANERCVPWTVGNNYWCI